jgi:hydrogenase/urease accessory protein HupE
MRSCQAGARRRDELLAVAHLEEMTESRSFQCSVGGILLPQWGVDHLLRLYAIHYLFTTQSSTVTAFRPYYSWSTFHKRNYLSS